MKKILHIINGEFFAGAERVQDLLAQRLPEFGYETVFVTLKSGEFASYRQSDAALHAIEMRSQTDLAPVADICELIRRENIALIHSHTVRSALIAMFCSYRTGRAMVHHVHSPADGDTESRLRNVRNSLTERLALHRALKLMPVSDSLVQYVTQRRYKPQRIQAIYNGVPVQEQSISNKQQPLICCVALMRPRKGIDTLITAFAALRKDCDARLRLVGPFETSAYEAQIIKQCEALGISDAVEFTGFCSDVNAQLRQADIFCLPSHYGEGMPMVILEAMAVGLPIISTHVEGIPEQVRHGEDGLLVAPGDSNALCNALLKACSDEKQRKIMGHNARTRQQEHFSDQSMARAVADVYTQIIEKG